MTTVLRRELSTLDLFTLGFGAIIGVGWIIIMDEWLVSAGPLGAILALALGAAAMIVIGLSYAEMAALLPVAGGEIPYAYEAFGLKASFGAGWILALAYVAGAAFEAIAVGGILAKMMPVIKGPALYSLLGAEVHLGPLIAGIAGTLALTWINHRSIKAAAGFQTVATGALVVVSVIFFVAAAMAGDVRNMEPPIMRDSSGSVWPGILAVLATVPFFFIGFNIIPQALGERAPGTDASSIRRTIIIAIVAACVFYCGAVLAAALIARPGEFSGSELPVYDATVAAFRSPIAGQLVLVAGLLGLITTWNAVFFASTRVLLALSRAGTIPEIFGRLHSRHRTPFIATLLVAALSIIGTCLGPGAILPIVNALGAATPLVFAIVCFGVLRMRRKRPTAVRRNLVELITPVVGGVISLTLCILALYQAGMASPGKLPTEWLLLAFWTVLGVTFWWFARPYRERFSEEQRRSSLLSDLEPESDVIPASLS